MIIKDHYSEKHVENNGEHIHYVDLFVLNKHKFQLIPQLCLMYNVGDTEQSCD